MPVDETPITDSYYSGRRALPEPPKRRVPWLSTLPYAAMGLCTTLGLYAATQFTEKVLDPLIQHGRQLQSMTKELVSVDRALNDLSARVQYGLQRREAMQVEAASQEERLKALQREAAALERRIDRLEQEEAQKRRR